MFQGDGAICGDLHFDVEDWQEAICLRKGTFKCGVLIVEVGEHLSSLNFVVGDGVSVINVPEEFLRYWLDLVVDVVVFEFIHHKDSQSTA